MRISDWSSDVCSSDLRGGRVLLVETRHHLVRVAHEQEDDEGEDQEVDRHGDELAIAEQRHAGFLERGVIGGRARIAFGDRPEADEVARKRSEEHTSELQSLMRISYAVFCLKKKKSRKTKKEN